LGAHDTKVARLIYLGADFVLITYLLPLYVQYLSPFTMTKQWKEIQLEIRRLYVTERKPLKEVRAAMKAEHNFDAS
jgi:hypothetical protein